MIHLIEQAFNCSRYYDKFVDYEYVKHMRSLDNDPDEIETWGKPLLFEMKSRNESIDVQGSYQPIWKVIKPLIEEKVGKVTEPDIAYINLFQHGDNSRIHTDREGYTCICYMNPEWNWNWGGETLFYDGDEVLHCQLPRGGDVIFFNGEIPHKAGLVSSHAPFPRMGLTYMFNEVK